MTTDEPEADANDETEPGDSGPDVAICPRCMAELPPMADFCPVCRGPVTAYANTGYYEGAISRGWTVGESVVNPGPRVVTVISLWLTCIPLLVVIPMMFWTEGHLPWEWLTVVLRIFGSGLFLLFAWCLYRGTRNFVRARRAARTADAPDDEGDETDGDAAPEGPAPPST